VLTKTWPGMQRYLLFEPNMRQAFCINIILESMIQTRNSLFFHRLEILTRIDIQKKIRILNMMNKLIN
jgi:hypothetical protein